jgi:hypothetical protein
MAQGLLTPLQLTAGAALLDNAGIRIYSTALDSYSAYYLIAEWQAAVNYYVAQPWSTSGTLAQLLSIGNSTCAALGNSIPTGAPTPRPIAGPVNTGFSGLIRNTGNLYLGNGDTGIFAQAFMTAQGFVSTTNVFINSAVNAQTYLGPTFVGMDSLTTNNISAVNSDLQSFGVDLGNQGNLVNFANINNYGTPAALLRQLSDVAGLQGGTLQVVEIPLVAAGLTKANIRTLVANNRAADPQTFDRYQNLAYQGMTRVTGAGLQQVLNILDVTTPNINTMADLLDQKMIFPNSWTTLTTPTAAGPVPVYLPDGGVDMNLADTVSSYLPVASGCEELGKIIPPSQAVANKAVQSAYQQVTGITQTTLPKLAETVLGQTSNVWSADRSYLANSTVNNGNTIPTYYRAQQNVPARTSLLDTDYWKPTSLGGISTMAGLPDIQAQTSAITQSVADFYKNNLATGTGPNGTLTVSDVLGAAAGYGYTDNLNSVVENFQTLNSSGALTALYTVYQNMLSAANDAAMLTLIGQANAAITTIVSNYGSLTTEINTAWSAMATNLNKEYLNQTKAGIVWADIPADNQGSVQGLIRNIPPYGLEVDAGGPAWFLDQVADTSVIGGQAIVGAMRESRNNQRLSASQLGVNTKPADNPAVVPSPVVVPVY